jgi:hypothetical protein
MNGNSDHEGNRVRRHGGSQLTGTVDRVVPIKAASPCNLLVMVSWDDGTATMEDTSNLDVIFGPALQRRDIMNYYETV